MKTTLPLYLLFILAAPLQAQWYQEDDETPGISFIGGIGKKVRFDNEDGTFYTDMRAFKAGIAKTTFQLHGHAQASRILLLTHQATKAQYHDGYKSLSMTNAEAHFLGSFSLGHVIFVGIQGGAYIAVPLVVTGETVRTNVPAFSKEYERPYFYQGFTAGGTGGLKLGGVIMALHANVHIPFLRIYKPQPENTDGTKVTPQLLNTEMFMFSITIKGRD
ncbi:MAG TPA: hypothetical protein PLL64_05875 [Rhodothermales bacterium]|nr:hypothetical protein [Rhodothermales bacterium]HRR07749.1 hypothetical protein [Rhodothermales bacterium]